TKKEKHMKTRQNSPIANRDSEQRRCKGAHTLCRSTLAIITLLLFPRFAASAAAQGQNLTSQEEVVPPSAIITNTATANAHEAGGGSTKIDLRGTELMPDGGGQVKVETKANAGRTSVDAEVKGMKPPSTLGSEFLTYVLWAVTPEGRTGNMGEILLNKNGDGKL